MNHVPQKIEDIDRKVLEVAFCLAMGELSTYGKHRKEDVYELMQEIIKEAKELIGVE